MKSLYPFNKRKEDIAQPPGNLCNEAQANGDLLQPEERIAEAFGSRARKFLTEFRSRNGDESLGTLGQILSTQIDSSMFRNNIIGLEPGRHNAGPFSKDRLDFRATLAGCGQHGNERPSPLASGGAIHKVMLASDAGEDTRAYRVSANLARKVYLQTGVD